MSETHREWIGKRAKKYRKISKLSQKDFAKKAGIPLDEYMRIENGEIEIRIARYMRLQDAAGIKPLTKEDYRPSVMQLFSKKTKPEQRALLHTFLDIEKNASEQGLYWVDYLKEFFPSMAELIQRMVEKEMYRLNSKIAE
jgi:transcriptional regulator with XRE-family HTH domain